MNTSEDTFDRLRNILMQHYLLPSESITPDAALEQLEIDSLGVMELFFAIEDEFGISVPNEQRELKTAGDIADYIDHLAAAQSAASSPSSAPLPPSASSASAAVSATLASDGAGRLEGASR